MAHAVIIEQAELVVRMLESLTGQPRKPGLTLEENLQLHPREVVTIAVRLAAVALDYFAESYRATGGAVDAIMATKPANA